jgi:hypothetical protein
MADAIDQCPSIYLCIDPSVPQRKVVSTIEYYLLGAFRAIRGVKAVDEVSSRGAARIREPVIYDHNLKSKTQ